MTPSFPYLVIMDPLLHRKFTSLQTLREAYVAEVASIPEHLRNRQPATGKWSPMQLMAHILDAERMSLAYLEKKALGASSLKDSGFKEFLKILLVRSVLRSPLKIKAPSVLPAPPNDRTLTELAAEWANVHEKYDRFLRTLPQGMAKKQVYRHPFAGMLNLHQALSFMKDHSQRHLQQLRKLRKKGMR